MTLYSNFSRLIAFAIIVTTFATACSSPLVQPTTIGQDIQTTAPSDESRQSYERGMVHLRDREYKLAIDEFTDAINRFPEYIEAYEQRANAYEALECQLAREGSSVLKGQMALKKMRDRGKAGDIRVEKELANDLKQYLKFQFAEGAITLIGLILVIWIWIVRRLTIKTFVLLFISAILLAAVVNVPFRLSIGVLAMLLASIVLPAGEKFHKKQPYEDHPLEIELANHKTNEIQQEQDLVSTRPCPQCGRINSIWTTICPRCGNRIS